MAKPRLTAKELTERRSWRAKERWAEERGLSLGRTFIGEMSDGLRTAIAQSGMCVENLAIEAAIVNRRLQRFIDGVDHALNVDEADRLCELFNLVLCIEDGSPEK